MRRMTLGLLLLALLAACGTTDHPATERSGVAAGAAYPTPSLAPAATPAPSAAPTALLPGAPASPPPAPPLEAQPAPLPPSAPLSATLSQTIELPNAQRPSDLIGWSPDGRLFLYLQAGGGDMQWKIRLAKLFVLDLATQQPTAIVADDRVMLGFEYESYTYPSSLPAWQEPCCVISAALIQDGQQALVVLDETGREMQRWPLPAVGHVALRQQQPVTSHQQTYQVGPTRIGPDLISQTRWMTATVLAPHGVYAHDTRRLQYVDDDGSGWIIDGTDTFLEGDRAITIERLYPSADGAWLLMTTTVNRSYNRRLWLLERETQQMQLITAGVFGYATLAPDNQTILWGSERGVNLYDRLRAETLILPNSMINSYPVWDATGSRVALLHANTARFDVYTLTR